MNTLLNTVEQLTLAKEVDQLLGSNIDPRWCVIERPQVLARYFGLNPSDNMTADSRALCSTIDAHCGQSLQRVLPAYLALHAHLVANDINEANQYKFANDSYIYTVADRQFDGKALDIDIPGIRGNSTTPVVQAKAFVVKTQSRNYLVVLHERYLTGTVHIRRFWDDLQESLNAPGYALMSDYADRSDLTLNDVILLATQAAEYYSDDLPGNCYPRRPSLQSFLRGSLDVGEESAGRGLRFGDARDLGYIASLEVSGTGRFTAKDMSKIGISELVAVMYNVASAFDSLNIEVDKSTASVT